jgi:hypothetical protein
VAHAGHIATALDCAQRQRTAGVFSHSLPRPWVCDNGGPDMFILARQRAHFGEWGPP